MSDPYRSVNAGDAILAETWNQIQRDVRDHIRSHTHSGDTDAGVKLTGASIDKSSTLEVDKLIVATTTTAALTASGPANLNGGLTVGAPASPQSNTIIGNLTITGSSSSIAGKNNYMASGSLTIGDIKANFGGGKSWNPNTAGLLLETLANTEIAVHDSMNRVASLMYYEGGAPNRVTIGRDMGWGPLGSLKVGCDLSVTGATTLSGPLTASGGLSVTGSLTIGGNHAVSAPGQAVRILWGFVGLDGTVLSGQGFTVTKDAVGGGFRIKFATPFAIRPCVMATVHYNGSILDNVVVFEINLGDCYIKTGDSGGVPSFRHFCFTVIGP